MICIPARSLVLEKGHGTDTFARRSAHTADTARRLAEATAKEEELRAQRASDEAALADLQRRLQDLEADLERMQINVEEVGSAIPNRASLPQFSTDRVCCRPMTSTCPRSRPSRSNRPCLTNLKSVTRPCPEPTPC